MGFSATIGASTGAESFAAAIGDSTGAESFSAAIGALTEVVIIGSDWTVCLGATSLVYVVAGVVAGVD